jgi:hypothetical protein
MRWLLLLLLPAGVWAQNLVPNGSFECGEDFCSAYQITEVTIFNKYACSWSVPTHGTTDVFSTLTPPACYTHMPNSGIGIRQGNQMPRSGSRFAGIYTYSKGLSPDTTSYREYLQVKLNRPLKPNQTYCAEMFVSRTEEGRWASNNLGMRFNVGPIQTLDYKTLLLSPQIVEKQIITDTVNWVRIGAFFEPEEAYSYLLIGNFYEDGSTRGELFPNQQNQNYFYGYYFIDDVTVEKLPYDNFIIQTPDAVCEGLPVELTASAGVDDEVIWTTLQDTTRIVHLGEKFPMVADTTTTFRVLAKGCGKRVVDTVLLNVSKKPILDLGRDTTLCQRQQLTLSPGAFTSYAWQDGTISPTFNVTKPGTYGVEITDAFNCKVTDEIEITYTDVPVVNLGSDGIVCKDFYSLEVNDAEYHYTWSDGSTDDRLRPPQSGTYWVEARNQCGTTRDSITLIKSTDVILPNVVTQNSDGYNDYLKFGYLNERNEVEALQSLIGLKVFNRWGNKVFESLPYQNNWPQQDEVGVYYYYVILPGCKELKGWLQVIR